VNVGKGIRFVRIASGLRQGDVAERLGITQNYLSLVENNKAEPSMSLLRKVSEVFGIPVAFLVWEDAMAFEGQTPEVTDKYEKIRDLIHELQRLRIAHALQEKGNRESP
jgi:transcriptional regulator with XRE-family HTH domain